MWPCTITCGTSDAYVSLNWGDGLDGIWGRSTWYLSSNTVSLEKVNFVSFYDNASINFTKTGEEAAKIKSLLHLGEIFWIYL